MIVHVIMLGEVDMDVAATLASLGGTRSSAMLTDRERKLLKIRYAACTFLFVVHALKLCLLVITFMISSPVLWHCVSLRSLLDGLQFLLLLSGELS